jgi:transposase InsO family protein
VPRRIGNLADDAVRGPRTSARRRGCSPARPSQNAALIAEEFYRMLDGVVINTTELFNDRLKEWEAFYNFNRPHGALGGQTPYEKLRQKTARPV